MSAVMSLTNSRRLKYAQLSSIYLSVFYLRKLTKNKAFFSIFQRCVQLSVDNGGEWVVEACETKARFICEHVIKPVR